MSPKPPIGTIIGHSAKQDIAEPVEVGIPLYIASKLEPGTRAYRMGECSIFNSISSQGHHLSISHPSRYPTWDEIAKARYALMPHGITVAMLLPSPSEYINVHSNCFQLWEVVDRRPAGRKILIPNP